MYSKTSIARISREIIISLSYQIFELREFSIFGTFKTTWVIIDNRTHFQLIYCIRKWFAISIDIAEYQIGLKYSFSQVLLFCVTTRSHSFINYLIFISNIIEYMRYERMRVSGNNGIDERVTLASKLTLKITTHSC